MCVGGNDVKKRVRCIKGIRKKNHWYRMILHGAKSFRPAISQHVLLTVFSLVQQYSMSDPPYPNYPPNYTKVDTVNGLTRNCIVLEVLTNGRLSNSEQAVITELLDTISVQVIRKCPSVEHMTFVTQNRFDPVLRTGLRLP